MTTDNESSSGFSGWLDSQLRARGIRDNYSAAGRLFGVPATTTRNWLLSDRAPSLESLRAIARGLNIPYLRVLVAAGIVTEEEAGVKFEPPALPETPLEDMFDEIRRRAEDTD